jgi:vancomycin resistance protein YoaR
MSSTSGSIRIPQPPKSLTDAIESIDPSAIARAALRAIAVVAVFIVAATLGLFLYGYAHVDRVYQGVTVAGVEVGGMTETEARSAIEKRYNDFLGQPVTLTFEGAEYQVVPRDAGVRLNIDATVDQALAFGRSGSIWGRSQIWTRAMLRGHDLPAVLLVDEAALDRAMNELAPEIARPPVNAYIDIASSGEPEVITEVPGIAFDIGTTTSALVAHVSTMGAEPIAVSAPPIQPDVKKEDLAPQLAEVQAAVGSTLVISGLDQHWAIRQDDLKRIVTVPGPGQPVEINRDAVKTLVRGIARNIEHEAVDAALVATDQGELQVIPSEASVDVNVNATVDAVVAALQGGQHDVALTIDREPAAISNEQAQAALMKAEALVADGLTLTWKEGTIQLGRGDLISALTVESRPGEAEPIVVGFSAEVVGILLGPVAETIDIEPVNGRYRLVDNKVELVEKGSNGRQVDIAKSANAIIDALTGNKDSAPLTIETLKPEFSSSAAKDIELPDVLATASTYYGNSSDARRQNVERAVELQTGWLIAPGDVFSYYVNIGKVDEDHGFVTGLGILSNGEGGITTAPVVGGGICQVSTTIFQSAFWAGLTIVERTAHPYWLQSYGQPPSGMKGLDAMVDIVDDPTASLDLKFQNNTGNWIAVVMTADGENVTSEIRGTNPGWSVKVEGDEPTISNIVEPPTETMYQDSPELAAGEERQVETAQQGFDATVKRVTRDKDGNVIDEYEITSTYVPSVNRILRGTGS